MTFVAIEGIDASGKNTQSKLLAQRLDAELFSFPDYNTISGKVILSHLKREWQVMYQTQQSTPRVLPEWQKHEHLDAFAFQAIQLMNRMEHAPRMYEVLYKEQRHVVADRYTASGMVYGSMDGLDIDYLLDIHRYLPQPDLWVLIDIDIETSLKRRPERRDRYESDLPYLERVIGGYRGLWDKMAPEGSWIVLDGRRPVGDIHRDILEAIDRNAS